MRKIFLLTGILLISAINTWSQNGTRLIGFDAVTSGRGGTATGYFDNPSLIMNNPAGLSFLKTPQADLSVSLMAPTVYFKNSINNTNGKNNVFPLGCISYAGKYSDKIAYGFGIFTQGGMGADFNLNHQLYKDANGLYVKQPYHSKFAVMQGGASIAYKLSDKISVGITADIVYGQVEFKMPMSMPPSMLKGVINPQTGFTFGDLFSADPETGGLGYSEVVASADMQKLTAFGFNGKIGIAYKPNESFSFGINYSLPVNLNYKNGNANMDMTYQMNDAFGKVVAGIMQQEPGISAEEAQQQAMQQFSALGIDLTKGAKDTYKSKASFGLPQSLAAGLMYAPAKNWRLSLDAEWIDWKHSFDQMDISLTGGTNANISKMLGTNGSIAMAFPLYWRDAIVIRTGAEFDASKKVTLRGGYAYGENPVPASTLFPVFPAVVVHHISVGGTYTISSSVKLNAAYEFALNNKENAASVSYAGAQYNNSVSGLKNSIYHLSVSWILK